MGYSAAFTGTLEKTLKKEGLWSNNPNDRGGATMYGCTEAICKKYGYDVRTLTIEQAQDIYAKEFWLPLRLDEIHAVSPLVAEKFFDAAVNCGPGRATRWLHNALNKFNRQGKDYADLNVEAAVGPLTINVLSALIDRRGAQGEKNLRKAFNAYQGVHYLDFAERDVRQEDFMFGWFTNRVD